MLNGSRNATGHIELWGDGLSGEPYLVTMRPPTHIYDRADQAMYTSKQGGRNRVTVAAEAAPWTAKLAS